MKKYLLIIIGITLFYFSSSISLAGQDSLYMYIPEGQIHGNYFKIFIPDKNITKNMIPKLTLKRILKEDEQSTDKIGIISTNQIFKEEVEGIDIYSSGTWIYFSIKKIHIPDLYTSLRVIPVLTWTEKDSEEKVTLIYPSYYFIGNGMGTTIWTIIIVATFLIFILIIFKRLKKRQFIGIICDEDGRVSMSLLQMGLWTVFVGAMIVAFGLLRLKVPNIPETLIMLMLFAAGTTTAGQFQTKVKIREQKDLEEEKGGPPHETNQSNENISKPFKFNSVFYSDKEDKYPSIAKIQVLFWTIITLMLFVYLSINEGELWDIPPELVILMGISQVTFLGRQQMVIQDVKAERSALQKAKDKNLNEKTKE